jgi:UDPglucose--hexose-1-phosphate uridylyltransferase
VRVVPNRYPALGPHEELDRRKDGLFETMNGVGVHEVNVETPDHRASLESLPPRHLPDVLSVWRRRMLDLEGNPRYKYVLVFRNHGAYAGATLEHPHAQLIAIPIVPKRVKEELKGSRAHYEKTARCVYCDLVQQERQSRTRIVIENESFVALAPFAPRFPFETWILPRRHYSSFERGPESHLVPLAETLGDLLGRLGRVLDQPPYNLVLHTAPAGDPELSHYHWHIEVMPKIGQVAGFEWGTGFYINPVPPEEAAGRLREV